MQHNELQAYLEDIRINHQQLISSRSRTVLDTENMGQCTLIKKLCTKEMHTIEWLRLNQTNFQLVDLKKCAQQDSGT